MTERLSTSEERNDKFSIIMQMIFTCCLQGIAQDYLHSVKLFFFLSINDHALISYDVPRSVRGSGVQL